MRLLDVNNFYAPTGGGVRTYHERRLARYRDGGDVTYALVVPSDREAEERDGACTLYHVPAVPIGAGYRQIVRAGALARVVARFAPDVVEMGSPFTLPPILAKVLRGQDVARVAFYHSDYPHTWLGEDVGWGGATPGGAILGRAARAGRAVLEAHRDAVYRGQDAVFVASRFLADRLQARGLANVVHTPLGVDVDVFSPARRSEALRAEHGIGADEKVVLFLARLGPEKGVDVLLSMLPALVATPGVRVVVGGHGPLAGRVDAAVAASGGRAVRIPYQRTREGVAAWMASADAYLSLGGWETFSLTTVESMACGTPVLGLPRAGVGELLGATDGGAVVEPSAAPAEGVRRVVELAGWAPAQRVALAERVRGTYPWSVALGRIEAEQRAVLVRRRGGAG